MVSSDRSIGPRYFSICCLVEPAPRYERIRVIAITLGTPSADPALHGDLAIEVINLSLFPIQICQIGFKLASGVEVFLNNALGRLDERDTLPELAPTRIKISLPLELPSRTSQTFVASTDDFGRIISADPRMDGTSVQGFAKTGTG